MIIIEKNSMKLTLPITDEEIRQLYHEMCIRDRGYTIQKGDSLRKIAQKYYGNSDEWI